MKIQAIDLFCGIGGLTYGLQKSGIEVLAGLDSDMSCKFTYEENNKANFIYADIRSYNFKKLKKLYARDSIKVLVGCAPCQPFSTMQNHRNHDKDRRWNLITYFMKAVNRINPDVVSMENVEGFTKTNVFKEFTENLKRRKYFVTDEILFCPDFGIPQKRKRLVLLASKKSRINIPSSTHDKHNYVLLRKTIKKLPHLQSGEVDPHDWVHRTSKLSHLNMQRIRQSRPNGTWEDWDSELLPQCYKKKSGQGYKAVYGRMSWDDVAPTITTQFCNIGSGRFGHPEQDRALSLREGALIQTFPAGYHFDSCVSPTHIARHIGNAVPPRLGFVIGEEIKKYAEKNCGH